MGTIYLGQGATGSDGVSESDLSGTGLLSLAGSGPLFGGAEVFQSNGAASGDGTVTSKFSSLDGQGRAGRIRYDTPKVGGMQVTMSHQNNDAWGMALRYGASVGGMSVKAAVAYSDSTVNGGIDVVNGSVAVLFPMGLSLAFGAAEQDDEQGGANDTEEWRYAKIGYQFKGSEMGKTLLFVDWNQNEDRDGADETSEYVGAGIVQIVEPLGMEVYAGYRNFSLDVAGTDPDDISVLGAGIRVSF
jgi:hypothetical protein